MMPNDHVAMLTLPDSDRLLAEVRASIACYYTRKVSRHGATPLGVDWSCVPSQELRFVQLLKLCNFSAPCSLNDVGCGYGALLAYLARHHAATDIDYLGIDLSPVMVRHAKRLWRNRSRTKFMVGDVSPRVADYSVASGIFNVKLDQPVDRWKRFVAQTLTDMHKCSRYGFAVNFMAPRAPACAAQLELYRTSAEPWIRYCEEELGSPVELLSAYGLREFTLLVRKQRSFLY
jgi:SAM-dependent methyltransferase